VTYHDPQQQRLLDLCTRVVIKPAKRASRLDAIHPEFMSDRNSSRATAMRAGILQLKQRDQFRERLITMSRDSGESLRKIADCAKS
jgi:hypothetical protein